MLLSRDRKFFPTNVGTRRLFDPYVPETGPFRRVSVTKFLRREVDTETARLEAQFIADAHAYVDHTGWWRTKRLIAHAYIRGIKEHGLRYEIDVPSLADRLGLKVRTVYSHIKDLRDRGFLQHYRKHYIDWKKTKALREAMADRVEHPEKIFSCARAVHEPGPSFPRSGAGLRTLLPDLKEGSFMCTTLPLTWKDSPDG